MQKECNEIKKTECSDEVSNELCQVILHNGFSIKKIIHDSIRKIVVRFKDKYLLSKFVPLNLFYQICLNSFQLF